MIYMYVQKPLLCGQWRKSRYKINIIHQISNNHFWCEAWDLIMTTISIPPTLLFYGIYCEINGIWVDSEALPFDFTRRSAWQ